MTTFWSWYITLLTVGSLVALFWLIFATRKSEVHKNPTEQTMGHAFDGIEEYDNPLPKWWFMLFLGTLVFSVGYLLLYRAWATSRACCRATRMAGPRSTSGSARWTVPMSCTARSSPNTPPCRSRKWPRTNAR